MPPLGRPTVVTHESREILDHAAAHDLFKKHLQDKPNLKKLHDEATKRGYTALDTPEETFAARLKARGSAPIKPIRGQGDPQAVQDLEVEFVGQSLTKGKDQGALVISTVRAGDNEETYELFLEAPEGNFQKAREHTVDDKGNVVPTHSWWSAWTGCLSHNCASTCLNSLWACTGTWAAYFWCVVAACGGCVLKCTGCATCNCSWWCRWATGCCSQ